MFSFHLMKMFSFHFLEPLLKRAHVILILDSSENVALRPLLPVSVPMTKRSLSPLSLMIFIKPYSYDQQISGQDSHAKHRISKSSASEHEQLLLQDLQAVGSLGCGSVTGSFKGKTAFVIHALALSTL